DYYCGTWDSSLPAQVF
nr:immunoglobulin light chain junction region [Macaca mulatta]MOX70974.1 immunoglobulin light chain junction region [Macaca mulatta]MOX74960.1 immunoglobulin light chain junction region [Macaca mulatta]MOX75971.1 immunoglobulin light chain junction region [Macaca mulatta]MOX77041.1 immunoglobulin light chain junction region [Macaca mulatta]